MRCGEAARTVRAASLHVQVLPEQASCQRGGWAGDREPFSWCDAHSLAGRWPRSIVRAVVEEELDAGRVESDGNRLVRLRMGVLDDDLVEALRSLEPETA